uniref:Gyp1p n=1 Tax=Ganoderma boninense TaxID=34458 RepID=A0A5K1K0F4_9APHY|nr:Gyp1p [Ganoderma boninense]
MLQRHLSYTAVHASSRRTPSTAVASICRGGVAHRDIYPRRHHHSSSDSRALSPLTPEDVATLDRWITAEKRLVLQDTLHPEHLADLYVTLPTRDGTRGPLPGYAPPWEGDALGYGHHLAFFHPRSPEKSLRWDGTDIDFSPPKPFTRRMWAGGRMEWKSPLHVGDRVEAVCSIASVQRKGFGAGETGAPMVFVKQKIEYRKHGGGEVCIEEERSHVYLAMAGNRRDPKEVKGLPRPDFMFEYLPTPTMLFRFSALTFNGHYIHLDKDYARKSEGYPERLVHGPLTALMLLDTTALQVPGSFKTFEYRAVNPIAVNRVVSINGAQEDKDTIRVWAEVEEPESGHQVVGMVGKITLGGA